MGTSEVNFYLQLAGRYGLQKEVERVHTLYQGGKKSEAALAVPEELVEGTGLFGEPDHIRSRLRVYADAKVTVLNLAPVGQDLTQRTEQLRLAKALMAELSPPIGNNPISVT
jgi:hypothetical protein